METVLAPGDTLLCYTDGVTEAANAGGEEFSEQRCLALLEAWTVQSPLPQALDALRLAVSGFTGQPVLDDDCTMLRSAVRQPEGRRGSAFWCARGVAIVSTMRACATCLWSLHVLPDCSCRTDIPDAGRLSRLQRYPVRSRRRAGRGAVDRSGRGGAGVQRHLHGQDGWFRQTVLPGVFAGRGVWQAD
ncbi:SpoIIE family protein phosphatase [Duganella radicis]|uniref:SpoIIE family protein phosphatase n=1 Tax=Duganella radicis TaxID=551988 RepID=A0A6L6PF58_9BURK|nr:SpoIIE family protein phosphatase [Duganella radicis]